MAPQTIKAKVNQLLADIDEANAQYGADSIETLVISFEGPRGTFPVSNGNFPERWRTWAIEQIYRGPIGSTRSPRYAQLLAESGIDLPSTLAKKQGDGLSTQETGISIPFRLYRSLLERWHLILLSKLNTFIIGRWKHYGGFTSVSLDKDTYKQEWQYLGSAPINPHTGRPLAPGERPLSRIQEPEVLSATIRSLMPRYTVAERAGVLVECIGSLTGVTTARPTSRWLYVASAMQWTHCGCLIHPLIAANRSLTMIRQQRRRAGPQTRTISCSIHPGLQVRLAKTLLRLLACSSRRLAVLADERRCMAHKHLLVHSSAF